MKPSVMAVCLGAMVLMAGIAMYAHKPTAKYVPEMPGLPINCLAVAPNLESFLETHCVNCHDSDEKKGGLDLTSLGRNFSDPANFGKWVTIHDRIASGEMPPKKKTRPPEDLKKEALNSIDTQLHAIDEARLRDSGRVRMRRMTRSEYENTLRDLLSLERLDIKGLLPADGSVAGFDKVAGALELSPAHLAAYSEAAENALTLAIATHSTPPPVASRRIYPAGLFKFVGNLADGQFVLLKDKEPDPSLPVRGGFEDKKGHVGDGPDREERHQLIKDNHVTESQSAVGLLNPNLAGFEAAMNVSPVYSGMYRLKVSVWGFQWDQGSPKPIAQPQAAVLRAHAEGKQQEGGRLLATVIAPSMQSQESEILTWLDEHESIVFDPVSVPWLGYRIGQWAGRAAKHVGPGVALDWFEFEGPINPVWPPQSHRCLFDNLPIAPISAGTDVVLPVRETVRQIGGYRPTIGSDLPPHITKLPLETVQSSEPEKDARRLLRTFIPRAFRRPVSAEAIESYVSLVTHRMASKDCFEDAMKRAYIAVLTSPEFLFHPADTKKTPGSAAPAIDAYTLASRLSYWLWNSAPDETLIAAARTGEIQTPKGLHTQVERLLKDPKSERFVNDFTDQWLQLDRVSETTPDKRLYPEYSVLLHEGMVSETRAFFRELISRDHSISSLLRPSFAMLNQRLAEHYKLPPIAGPEIRRVELPSGNLRGGLLAQAAILKLTANGTTTSPVKRGVWVMDRLLNDPAPPPPPGVSAVDPDTRGTTTIREQLDRHRTDANCAACHTKIDAAGFALERFDPVGGFRERYRSTDKGLEPEDKNQHPWQITYKLGPEVDASGTMPDGRPYTGPGELIELLAADPVRLANAFTTQLSRYATGTDVSYYDRHTIEQIVASTADKQYGMRCLIHAFAQSQMFSRP